VLKLSKICVFVGPTRLRRIPEGAHIFTPAVLGSVFRAVQEGYTVICLVDGFFGNSPSVWHKEILFALQSGVRVCGASSMGALRAAELHAFGMVGFGWVYRAFRRGVLQDDDEVCVLHAPQELDFAVISEAMVNIRYSLRIMRSCGELSRESEIRIAALLKDLHFSNRTSAAIRSAFDYEFGDQGCSKYDIYQCLKVDVKISDANLMLSAIPSFPAFRGSRDWHFNATRHWLQQFLIQNGDIPPLSRWRPKPVSKD
jgi:hypothetical protein